MAGLNRWAGYATDYYLLSFTTGIQCNGKVARKRFNGTVIVEGCHEPVRMLIHANGRHMYVTDGYKRTVIKKPAQVVVQVEMKKKNNIVYVTVSDHYVIHKLFMSRLLTVTGMARQTGQIDVMSIR